MGYECMWAEWRGLCTYIDVLVYGWDGGCAMRRQWWWAVCRVNGEGLGGCNECYDR